METFILVFYFISLLILFSFGIHSLVLVHFLRKYDTKKTPEYPLPEPNKLPIATIQIPFYNEQYVAERLVRSVCSMNYPIDKLEIQVLDDSTDETQAILKKCVEEYSSQGFNIKYLHRTNRAGFKAGALKAGLEVAEGEFIAIFDADFLPNPDFLIKTIPQFTDPNVGMVQTRWEHLNEEYSYITKAQALSLDGHFAVEQYSRFKTGCFINFNGTAGIWRKSCIIDAGNWQSDTLTEDLDLSYRAQMKGWKFVYLNNVTSPAELPLDINALKTQQFRWTKGAIETARKLLPTLLKSKLPTKIKLEGIIHLTSNIVYPFILIVALLNLPVVVIKNYTSAYDTFYAVMSIFVLASISTFLFYTFAQQTIHHDWRKRLLLFPLFMAGSMGFAVNNTKAVIEALIGKKSSFTRTPKVGIIGANLHQPQKTNIYHARKIHKTAIVELLFALYFVVCVGVSIYYVEIAAIPFQLMFLLGFGIVGFLSLKEAYQ
ncbi:MAG: cellulose synthase family protein [Chloroherpetonaceae bacterium]